MKLKKNDVQSVDSSVLKMGNKIFIEGGMKTMFWAESEGMAIQSLPYLGIHSIYIQPPNLDNIL